MKAKQDKFGCLMSVLSLLICLIGSLHLCVCECVFMLLCFLCAYWYPHINAHSLALFCIESSM